MKICEILIIATLIHLAAAQLVPFIPCNHNTSCSSIPKLPKDTYCKDGYCVCPQGGKIANCSSVEILPNFKNTTSLVYRACKHDQDCKLENGHCNTTNSQCECLKGYVSSSNQFQCLKVAPSINSTCQDDKQCNFSVNTTCARGHCVCKTGYHAVGNTCWRSVGFGDPCKKLEECSYIEGAICTKNMVCGCQAENVISHDIRKCLSIVYNIFDNCTESTQCFMKFNHSTCIDHVCQCSDKYHYANATKNCIASKGLDEPCDNPYDCYQSEDEIYQTNSLLCLANTCICAEGFDRADDKCIPPELPSGAGFTFSIAVPIMLLVATMLC